VVEIRDVSYTEAWENPADHLFSENDVPLVDEYDAIMRDIHIFHAFSPAELNKRVDAAMTLPDTFWLRIRNGRIKTRTNLAGGYIEGAQERIEGQIDLLREFGVAEWIPDCRAIYSVHDTPQSFISHEHRVDLQMHVDDRECECRQRDALRSADAFWQTTMGRKSSILLPRVGIWLVRTPLTHEIRTRKTPNRNPVERPSYPASVPKQISAPILTTSLSTDSPLERKSTSMDT
jgi:hypothetical protein